MQLKLFEIKYIIKIKFFRNICFEIEIVLKLKYEESNEMCLVLFNVIL